MKMSKVSPEKLKKAKEKLVNKWNNEVACKKPSQTRIRKYKKHLKRLKENRQDFVTDQMEQINETLEQEQIVREYLAGSTETESVRPEIF